MVVNTYSVIIQNQKTMELFSQYQTLFAEAINSGRIGVCKWYESGTTVETALPELNHLTDDKTEWRAIIVRYVDDSQMASFECDARNPYDFKINAAKKDLISESPVPLIRLTHMLGGVPPCEVEFKTEIIREKYKAPRTVYVPVENKEKEAKYQQLVKKYKFDGKAPSAILIVSIRNSSIQDENIGRAWMTHKESDSSEFWKRNHFPSICRFLVYDFAAQGPIQRCADEFGFWYSIMLLSINEWDSSTIQAYRLYDLKTVMDVGKMSESFQALADKLRDAKHCIENSIKRDIESDICEAEDLPEYRVDVPVSIKLPESEDRLANPKSYSLISAGASTDISIWNHQRNAVEERYVAAVKAAERTLEKTADKMRPSCSLSEDEISPLNKYQVEDLTRETNSIYHQIVAIQGDLPTEHIASNSYVSNAASDIKRYLLGRTTAKPAILSIILSAMLVVWAAIPAIVSIIRSKSNNGNILLLVIGGSILSVAVVALCVLLAQKAKLSYLIRRYNQHMKNAFNKLVENASEYSAYMSNIASYSRGKSYLSLSNRIQHHSNASHYSKYKHLKAIGVLLGKLKSWSKALHLDVDFVSKRPETRMEIDFSVSPAENKLYMFESGESYPVVVNNSGMSLKSPYPFAKRIEIVREELYDDD